MLTYLKKSLFILLLLTSTAVWANDEHHFIYIQSEKGELFYVRYKGKVLSASAKGYVIVPELPKGVAEVIVGFPKNEIPEKHFSITLSGTRDEGFVIKHTGAQDIALFNLQTYTLLKPTSPETAVATAETPAPATTDSAGNTTAAATPPVTDASSDMMSHVKKDLDSTFANKQDITVSGGPTPAPAVTPATPAAKQPSKFASALDKVVSDDRPAEMDEPAPATPAVDSNSTVAAPKKAKKPAKGATKDPLTAEEKTYLADVLAEEQKTAAAEEAPITPAAIPVVGTDSTVATTPAVTDAAPATTPVMPAPAATPPTDTTIAAAYTETATPAEQAPAKKEKKKKHTAADDPQFIDFNAGANTATTTAASTDATASATPTEETPKPVRKKKQKIKDDASSADSTGSLKSDEWVTVNKPATTATADGTTAVAPKSTGSTEPALNSDCKQMLNNEGFKKLMKRVSAQGNEAGIVETFNKNIRNTCLSADQIRAFAQLIDTDEYRYKLLETGYLHTYETKAFAGLQDLLKDDYYRKRFAAMLR